MLVPEPPGSPVVTRRMVLGGAGASALGVVAGTRLAHALQIESTPPAPPAASDFAAADDPIVELAAILGYDQEAIFAFVRDEIAYETYAGVLRGANGTLLARAGNAADQATLLAALLAESAIPHRLAIAPLDDDSAAELTARLSLTSDDATSRFESVVTSALAGVGSQDPAATPAPLSAEEETALADVVAQGANIVELAAALTDASRAVLGSALSDAGITLPPIPPASLAERERARHAWIQVPDGPIWVDLDPTLPDRAATTPAETFETFPDDWYHAMAFRIVAEDLYGNSLARRDVVTLTTTSQRVVDVPIAVNFAPAEAIAGLGSTLNQLFSGQLSLLPSLYADGTSVDATQPLMFATDGSTIIGALDTGTPIAGAADGETLAVWLVVDITSPDAAPITLERAIIDRVPVAARATGVIDPITIAPIKTATSAFAPDEMDTVDELNTLIVLHVDVARVPGVHGIQRAAADQVMGQIAGFGPSLAALRDGLGAIHETEAGVWSYPSAPNVTAFTFATGTSDTAPGRIAVDLLHRQRTTIPFVDVAPESPIHPLVLSGVLDAMAEHVLLEPIRSQEAAIPIAPSIAAIVEQAAADGVSFRVVTDPTVLDTGQLGEEATARITAALETGAIVVVPDQPVMLGGEPRLGWWIVDPVTGRTTDQLEDGSSGASTDAAFGRGLARAGDTLPFYARWVAWLRENKIVLNCLGTAVGGIVGVAALILSLQGSISPVFGALGTAKALSDLYKIPNACL